MATFEEQTLAKIALLQGKLTNIAGDITRAKEMIENSTVSDEAKARINAALDSALGQATEVDTLGGDPPAVENGGSTTETETETETEGNQTETGGEIGEEQI